MSRRGVVLFVVAACSGEENRGAALTCPAGTTHVGAPYPKSYAEGCYKRDAAGHEVKHGPYRAWSNEGRVTEYATYADDVPHGFSFTQSADGSLSMAGLYEHGEYIGEWWTWGAGGVLDHVTKHLGGGAHLQTYYAPDGATIARTECYADARLQWTVRGSTTRACP